MKIFNTMRPCNTADTDVAMRDVWRAIKVRHSGGCLFSCHPNCNLQRSARAAPGPPQLLHGAAFTAATCRRRASSGGRRVWAAGATRQRPPSERSCWRRGEGCCDGAPGSDERPAVACKFLHCLAALVAMSMPPRRRAVPCAVNRCCQLLPVVPWGTWSAAMRAAWATRRGCPWRMCGSHMRTL